ncbi:MAG: (d)CMP kinase [Bacillota bacterium]|jgi:cytidylate kinase
MNKYKRRLNSNCLPVIAIDGPAGAGKSTVARLVAERLNYIYIDTGALYRALTYKALQKGIDLRNEEALSDLAANTNIILLAENGAAQRVFCDDEDVTYLIRTPEVSRYVPIVARVPGVRANLVRIQREMSLNGGAVLDGRDIGSYVLPDAEFKFFLTASNRERALRRQQELAAKGFQTDLIELEKEMIERDLLDSQREVGPLVQVPDAVVIDTTTMTIEEVVCKMLEIINGGEK